MVTVRLHCRISGSFQMPSKVRFPLKSSREITSRYSFKLTSKIKLLEVCVRQKSRFEKFVWTGRVGDLELTFAHTCAVVTAECILLTGRALENWANHRRREGDGGIQRRSKRSIYCFVTLDIRSLIPIPGYIVFLTEISDTHVTWSLCAFRLYDRTDEICFVIGEFKIDQDFISLRYSF